MLKLFGSPPDVQKLENTRDVKGLIKALEYKKDFLTQENAIEALGRLRDVRAALPLAAVIEREEGSLVYRAVDALFEYDGLRAVEPLQIKQVVKILITALGSSVHDDRLHERFQILLSGIGQPAVEQLIDALATSDCNLYGYLAKALVRIRDPRAVEPLLARLGDKEAKIRISTIDALGAMREERALEPLIAVMHNDADNSVRRRAVRMLSRFDADVIAEPLIDAARNDTDDSVRKEATHILSVIGSEKAVDCLIALFCNKDTAARAVSDEVSENAFGAQDIRQYLIDILDDKRNPMRDYTLKAIAESDDKRFVEPLLSLLGGVDDRFRMMLIEVLAQFGDERAVASIAKQYVDADSSDRKIIEAALDKIGGPGTSERALSEQNEKDKVRKAAQQEQMVRKQQIDLLANELIKIGRTIGFLSMKPGDEFNEDMRHIRTREIGERLNQIGGLDLMREVGGGVSGALRDIPGRGRELEAAWVGIGRWM